METPNDPEVLRTLADLDAWVEEETPRLPTLEEWQASKGGLSPEAREAVSKVIFTGGVQRDNHVLAAIRLLRMRTPLLRRPILEAVKTDLRGSWAKSKSELIDSLLARDQLHPLEQIRHDADIYPYRPFRRVDDLAVLTAFFAVVAESVREQNRIRVVFPKSVRGQSGCHWRTYEEPFTPAEFLETAPDAIARIWYLPRIRHWYADTLLPGYKVLLEEIRQSREYGRWLMTFTDVAAATGTSHFGSMLPGSKQLTTQIWRSGQDWTPDVTEDEAPTFEEKFLIDHDTDVEDEVVERLERLGNQEQAHAILRLLNPNEGAWLERYSDAQARGLTDQEFAVEEGASYEAFRKRKQRIRDRIKSIDAMSQTGGNLGLIDREESEEDVNTMILEEVRQVSQSQRQDRDERQEFETTLLAAIGDLYRMVVVASWGRPPAQEAEDILAAENDIADREDAA